MNMLMVLRSIMREISFVNRNAFLESIFLLHGNSHLFDFYVKNGVVVKIFKSLLT